MGRKRHPDPVKFCDWCGKALSRKRYGGQLESLNMFRRRRFCDLECSAHAQTDPEASRSAFSKRARRYLKKQCEGCGSRSKLSIHHANRNWRDNTPSNLKTLCSSCHTRLHHEAGEINPAREPLPCRICGKPSARRDLCPKHLTREKRYGDPELTRRQVNGQWVTVRDAT